MSLSFRKKILIDCPQSKSESSTDTQWTNKLPESLILTKDSTLSVYSAFINKRGSDQSTIDIEPANDLNKPNAVETNITISYYKNATPNMIPMPYNWCISSIQKNMIVARDNLEGMFFDNSGGTIGISPFGETSAITDFKDFNLDTGQIMNSGDKTAEANNFLSFAFCDDIRPSGELNSQFISRLGALPYGNLENQSVYNPLDTNNEELFNNVFKSYLIDACMRLDGSRCKTHEFNIFTNKYDIVKKNVVVNIPPDNYTPNQLGTLISNQLNNTENNQTLTSQNLHTNIDDIRNVKNENNDENGLYFETPCSDKGFALYQSRQKIENGLLTPIQGTTQYPSESPIVQRTDISTNAHPQSSINGKGFFFNPIQDSFYECGQVNLARTPSNFIGQRCDAYFWSMMSNNTNKSNKQIPARVHFRFPETLHYAQELVSGFGLQDGEEVIDFNSNVKKNILDPTDPLYRIPNLTRDNTTKNQGGTGYLRNKGDYNGYLLTSLEWNKTNLLKVKDYFDHQQIEGIQEFIYVYDWAFNDTPGNTNITSRNDTIRGKLDKVSLDASNNPINTGNRYIHIGQRNNLDLRDPTNNPENNIRGGTEPLLTTSGNAVYNNTYSFHFPLMEFGSDFLGDDSSSQNNSTGFQRNTHFKYYQTRANGNNFIGEPHIENTTTNYSNRPCTYSFPSQNTFNNGQPSTSDRKLNGSFDIITSTVKYASHLQLISVRPFYTDRRGKEHLFDFPIQLTQNYIDGDSGNEFDNLMEEFGFGYCYKYSSRTDDPLTNGKDYIMLFVGRNDGGLSRDVLSFHNNGSGTLTTSQSLFWNPFFSSGGCNMAVMDLIGQGTNLGRNTKMDSTNGNINLSQYPLSIMEIGGGSLLPQISYNQDQNRFAISDLYTPFTSTNTYNFTKAEVDGNGNIIKEQQGFQNPNPGNEVILFNRNFKKYYGVDTKFNNSITAALTDKIFWNLLNSINEIFSYNYLYKPSSSGVIIPQSNSMYYSQSGVYIEKWIEKISDTGPEIIITETEDNFNKSIWFLLGFTYSQTHNNSFTIKKRGLQLDTDREIPLFRKFRNGATINEDGTLGNNVYYSMPITNNTDLYNTNFNNLLFVNPEDLSMFLNQGSNNVNTLEILSTSTQFIADRLAVRNSIPYFILCSDILSKSGLGLNFYSQDNLLSAVDIVQQSVNTSDFYEFTGNMIHEINTEYQINNITHQIFKSNGEILNTNEFSSVIYLAEINIIVGLNPSQQQFYEEQKELIEKQKEDSDKLLQILENPKTQKEKIMSNLLESNLIIRKEFDIPAKDIEEIIEEIEVEDK